MIRKSYLADIPEPLILKVPVTLPHVLHPEVFVSLNMVRKNNKGAQVVQALRSSEMLFPERESRVLRELGGEWWGKWSLDRYTRGLRGKKRVKTSFSNFAILGAGLLESRP